MQYKNGDIVYWVSKNIYRKPHYMVELGVVDEEFSDAVIIDKLHMYDTRYLEGIPYKDYPQVSDWRKLPKGWTWNTKLFEIENKEMNDSDLVGCDLSDAESIKKLLKRGILVKLKDYDQSYPTTEIDTKLGWRIRKKYTSVFSTLYEYPTTSLPRFEIFKSYNDAQQKVEAIEKELQRQSMLSDEEWVIEQIDRKLDYWAYLNSKTKEEKQAIRDFLLSQDNVDDIEVRSYGNTFQWKYSKKRKWAAIEI